MASVHCTSPKYNTSKEQKNYSRKTAKEHKFGSPHFRDLLRKKCQVRVREARMAEFDGSRFAARLGEESFVSKILRNELAELEADLEIQEEIYKELIDDMNSWFVEEMEEDEKYLIKVGDSEIVFCPVCQKEELIQTIEQNMICQCGVSGSPELLGETLKKIVGQHDLLNCGKTLNFFVEQNLNEKILIAICKSCDYFIIVN